MPRRLRPVLALTIGLGLLAGCGPSLDAPPVEDLDAAAARTTPTPSGLPEAEVSGGPEQAEEPPAEGATTLGPLAILLPDDLGPWSEIDSTVPEVSDGLEVEGAWLTSTADGVVVNAVSYLPASTDPVDHTESIVEAFGAQPARELQWTGTLPSQARVMTTDAWTFLLLAVTEPDGAVVVLLAQGPAELLADGALEESVVTAVHTG